MIDYATYQRIHHLHHVDKLTLTQIARKLALHPRTVRLWLDEPAYRPRRTPPRPSKLDPYKPLIRQWLEHHPYSATQIFQRLRDSGFTGGISIVREYVRKVRPQKAPAFLTLHFEPGECAQVDWGHYGSVNVGNTRRQLSFFVLVLCYSRLMYVQFTVSQTLEHFLGCHVNAFEALGSRVPARIMVDNLKSAVLRRLSGEAPVFNPRYVDFARHYGFEIAPCNVGAGHEKGRVEAGVGYVKRNLLAGLEIADFSHLNPIARQWLDTVANVRIHGETRRRPVDLFEEERDKLQPLPETVHDFANLHAVRASNRFRVTFQTNRYSVPAQYASRRLTLKGLAGPHLHLPPRPARRPASAQLRPPPGLRTPRSSQGPARPTQERPPPATAQALPEPHTRCRALLHRTAAAPLQRDAPHPQDRRVERDPRRTEHRPGPGRRPALRGLQ